MSDYLQAIGRVLISAVFIVFGYIQFTHIGNYIANPVVIKVAGWTAHSDADDHCLSGRGDRSIRRNSDSRRLSNALGLDRPYRLRRAHAASWCIISGMEGPARAANQGNFYKNLAIIGALLLIFVHGPGTCSLEHRFAKK